MLQVIWSAFLLAVVLYTPIPFLVLGAGADGGAAAPPGVRSGLYAAALGAAVASFATRRWWTNALLAAARAAATPTDAWARLRAGCILTWALSEAVALIGVGLAVVAHRPADGMPFAAVAALLLCVHRPAAWPLRALEPGGGRSV